MHPFMPLFIFLQLFMPVAFGVSPYAPLSVGTSEDIDGFAHYAYDHAGNRLSNTATGNTQSIVMGLVSKPVSIQQGNNDPEQFLYGPVSQRYMRVHADHRKTLYLNGMEYRLWGHTPQSVVQIHTKGYGPIVQVHITSGVSPEYTYLFKDHLGSPVISVNDAGEVQNRYRFEPWGRLTEATGVAENLSVEPVSAEAVRGFTGHETIASANLIHMNGRVEDPAIGMFIGPDPKLHKPLNLPNLSRYSLINNSPLNGTDPTGYDVKVQYIKDGESTRAAKDYEDNVWDLIEEFGDVPEFDEMFRKLDTEVDQEIYITFGPEHKTTIHKGRNKSNLSDFEWIDISWNPVLDFLNLEAKYALPHEMRHAAQRTYLLDEFISSDVFAMAKNDLNWIPFVDMSSIKTFRDTLNYKREQGYFTDILKRANKKQLPLTKSEALSVNSQLLMEYDAMKTERAVALARGLPEQHLRTTYSKKRFLQDKRLRLVR